MMKHCTDIAQNSRFEKRVPARKFASTRIDVFDEDVSADATNQLEKNTKYSSAQV
jgi:hypothetical protein